MRKLLIKIGDYLFGLFGYARMLPMENQVLETVKINAAATSIYTEVLEYIVGEVMKYFEPYANISAHQTMRQLRDFSANKLDTLKIIEKEYGKIRGIDEKTSKD